MCSDVSTYVCESGQLVTGKRKRGVCVRMIKRTVTNAFGVGEAMRLSRRDIGQVYQDTHPCYLMSLLKDGTGRDRSDGEVKKIEQCSQTTACANFGIFSFFLMVYFMHGELRGWV